MSWQGLLWGTGGRGGEAWHPIFALTSFNPLRSPPCPVIPVDTTRIIHRPFGTHDVPALDGLQAPQTNAEVPRGLRLRRADPPFCCQEAWGPELAPVPFPSNYRVLRTCRPAFPYFPPSDIVSNSTSFFCGGFKPRCLEYFVCLASRSDVWYPFVCWSRAGQGRAGRGFARSHKN